MAKIHSVYHSCRDEELRGHIGMAFNSEFYEHAEHGKRLPVPTQFVWNFKGDHKHMLEIRGRNSVLISVEGSRIRIEEHSGQTLIKDI